MQALAKIKEDILVFIGFKKVEVTNVRITPVQAQFDTNIELDEFLREKIPVQIWKTNIREYLPVLLFDGITKTVQPVKSKSHTIMTKVFCESNVYHTLSTTYLSTLIGNIEAAAAKGIVQSATDQILSQKLRTSVNIPTSDFKFLNAYLLERGRLPFDILQYLIDAASHADAQTVVEEIEKFRTDTDFGDDYRMTYIMTETAQKKYLDGNDDLTITDESPYVRVHNTKSYGFVDIIAYLKGVAPVIENFYDTAKSMGKEDRYDYYKKSIADPVYASFEKKTSQWADIFRLPLLSRMTPDRTGTSLCSREIYDFFGQTITDGPTIAFYAIYVFAGKSMTGIEDTISFRISLRSRTDSVATTVTAYTAPTFSEFVTNGLKEVIPFRSAQNKGIFRLTRVTVTGSTINEKVADAWGMLRSMNSQFSDKINSVSPLYYFVVYVMIKLWNNIIQNQASNFSKTLQQVLYESSFSKVNTSSNSLDYWRHAVPYKIFDFHKLDSRYDADKIFDVFSLLKKNVGVEILTRHLSKISTSSYKDLFQTFYEAYGYNLVYTFPRYIPAAIAEKTPNRYTEAILMPEQVLDMSPILYTVVPSYLVREFSKKVKLDTTDFIFRVVDRKLIDLIEKQVPQLYSVREDRIYDMKDLDTITDYTDDLYTEPRIIDLSINSVVAQSMYDIKHIKTKAETIESFIAASLPDPKGTFQRAMHITARDFYKEMITGTGAGRSIQEIFNTTYTKTLNQLQEADGPWIALIITILNDYMKAHVLSFEVVRLMVRISLGELKAYTKSIGRDFYSYSTGTVDQGTIVSLVGTRSLFPVTVSDLSGKPLNMNNFNESIINFRSMAGSKQKGTQSAPFQYKKESDTGKSIQELIIALEIALTDYMNDPSVTDKKDYTENATVFKVLLTHLCAESGFLKKVLLPKHFSDGGKCVFDAAAPVYLLNKENIGAKIAVRPTEEAAYKLRGTAGGVYCKWHDASIDKKYEYTRLTMGLFNIGGIRNAVAGTVLNSTGKRDYVHLNYKSLADALSSTTRGYLAFLKPGNPIRSLTAYDPLDSNRKITKAVDIIALLAEKVATLPEGEVADWYIALMRDLGYYEPGAGTRNYAWGFNIKYNSIHLPNFTTKHSLKGSNEIIPENKETVFMGMAQLYGDDNKELVNFYVDRYAEIRSTQATNIPVDKLESSGRLPWGDKKALYTPELARAFMLESWTDIISPSTNNGRQPYFVAATDTTSLKEAVLTRSGTGGAVTFTIRGKRTGKNPVTLSIPSTAATVISTGTTRAATVTATSTAADMIAITESYGPVLSTIPFMALVKAIDKYLNHGIISDLDYITQSYYGASTTAVTNQSNEPVFGADDSVRQSTYTSKDDYVAPGQAATGTISVPASELTDIRNQLLILKKSLDTMPLPTGDFKRFGMDFLRAITDVLLQHTGRIVEATASVIPPEESADDIFSPYVVNGTPPKAVSLVPDCRVGSKSSFFGYTVALKYADNTVLAVPEPEDMIHLYQAAFQLIHAKTTAKEKALANFVASGSNLSASYVLFHKFTVLTADIVTKLFLAAYAHYKGNLTLKNGASNVQSLPWADVLAVIIPKYFHRDGVQLSFTPGKTSLRGVRSGSKDVTSAEAEAANVTVADLKSADLDHRLGGAIDIQYTEFIRREESTLELFMEDMQKLSVRTALVSIINANATLFADYLKGNLPPVNNLKAILGSTSSAWSITVYSRHIHFSTLVGSASRRGKLGTYKGS